MDKKIILPDEINSAQFIDTYFPIVDGVVRTVHNYASIMNEQSYSCVVCPDQKGSFDDSALPYDVIRTASIKVPVMNYAICVPFNPITPKKVAAKGNIDIIHTHSPFMLGFTALKTARKMGIPIVTTFHSKYYDDIYMVTKSRMLAKFVTDRFVSFYNKCDAVWACSESTAETLRSYGYKKEIFPCPNGSDFEIPKNLELLKGKVKEEYKITSDRKTLLFVGSLIWQKNLKCIFDTMKILCEKEPLSYRLVLAGTGNHEAAVKKYAEQLNFLPGQVIFTGRIDDREKLSALYALSDLFFFPSVYDNAPLVLREAAAMGTPALLAEGSNSAEAVKSDFNGFTAKDDPVKMAEKIRDIFKNSEALSVVRENARKTIPVRWQVIIETVRNKYAEIIEAYNIKNH